MAVRATEPFSKVIQGLVAEAGTSVNGLAEELDVDRSNFWRMATGRRPVTPEVCAGVARQLKLPRDYFAESREQAVIEAVRTRPELRDRFYDQL